MARRKTDLGTSSSPQYTRAYDGVRGVDFSSDPSQVAPSRAANLLNMYRDYDSEHGAAIETIPGYRCLFDFLEPIHGIWGYASSQDEEQEEYIIVHAGTKLFAFKLKERDSGVYEECFDGLRDGNSSAFLQNNNFYICDGTNIFVMSPRASKDMEENTKTFDMRTLEDAAYVPITYLSGAAYEQRNMLTDKFINRETAVVQGLFEDGGKGTTFLEDIDGFNEFLSDFDYEGGSSYYSDKTIISFKGRSRELDELDVRSILNTYYGERGEYGGNTGINISWDAIKDLEITRLIGYCNLWSEEDIASFKAKGGEYYSGEEEDTPMYGMYYADIVIYDPCEELLKVTVNGKEIVQYSSEGDKPDIFYMPVREKLTVDGEEKWYISFIHVYAKNRSDIDTAEVDIYGVAESVKLKKSGEAAKHTDYLNANKEYDGTAKEAILGCSLSATFDGRVFLTGNAKLPNTVFYSCRDLTGYNNPAYYGVYNYFNDGVDNSPNVALLATSSVLMVLKGNTISGSAIYYHTGADGLDDVVPRIYPSVPGVAGIGCAGAAINFLDDAVFISDRGLEGVSKEALNLERTIGHRSSTIDRVLKGNGGNILADAKLCRWGGYLCIFDADGRVFLGDSRQLFQGVDGSAEYEWFFLDGVGGYRNDNKRYRTLTVLPSSLDGATVDGATLSVSDVSEYVDYSRLKEGYAERAGVSVAVHFVEDGERKLLCDTDGEREGGDFFPACVGYSVHGILFFGTTGGQICCFNTDRRGQSVEGDTVDADRIHRSLYSFAGHRYSSWVAFKSDNCGISHLTKRTTRKTCVLKLKAMQGSSVSVRVRTDRETWEDVATSSSNNIFSFDDIDFENFTFDSDDETVVTVKEKKKKWVEKQFLIRSDGYLKPFGLYSLSYNYEIQGKVKK